jgi:hypothetical protein
MAARERCRVVPGVIRDGGHEDSPDTTGGRSNPDDGRQTTKSPLCMPVDRGTAASLGCFAWAGVGPREVEKGRHNVTTSDHAPVATGSRLTSDDLTFSLCRTTGRRDDETARRGDNGLGSSHQRSPVALEPAGLLTRVPATLSDFGQVDAHIVGLPCSGTDGVPIQDV